MAAAGNFTSRMQLRLRMPASEASAASKRLSETRTLLSSNPHFIFERIELAPNSNWCLEASQETWLLVVRGSASAGPFDLTTGDGVFAQADRVHLSAGRTGVAALVAYTGGLVPDLLYARTHGNNLMSLLQRIAFIGNHLPRRCGIQPSPTIFIKRYRSIERTWKPASSP